MENASKALVMAGTILISLMVISALMLSYNNFRHYEQTKSDAKEEKDIVEFNNQYTVYYRNNVRGTDLISLVNKVTDYNLKDENQENNIKINIDLNGEEKDFSYSGENELIINSKYNQQDFKSDIINNAKKIEGECGGEATCFSLVSNIANIIDDDIKDTDAILQYYEYVQFKRARFNGTEINYNDKGKVELLSFEFTGNFN